MEVSKSEAIATVLLAKMIGRELGNVSALTTQASKNISNDIDVNKMISQLTVTPQPKPEGPIVRGASVDGDVHEVVLYKVDNPPVETPIEIANPFNAQKPMNSGLSPMAQFLRKPTQITTPVATIAPVPVVEAEAEDVPLKPSQAGDSLTRNILEMLIKMDIKLTKIQKQLKKPNEGKIITE